MQQLLPCFRSSSRARGSLGSARSFSRTSQTPGCSAAQTSFDTVSLALIDAAELEWAEELWLRAWQNRERPAAVLGRAVFRKKMTVSGVGGVLGRDAGRKALQGGCAIGNLSHANAPRLGNGASL